MREEEHAALGGGEAERTIAREAGRDLHDPALVPFDVAGLDAGVAALEILVLWLDAHVLHVGHVAVAVAVLLVRVARGVHQPGQGRDFGQQVAVLNDSHFETLIQF